MLRASSLGRRSIREEEGISVDDIMENDIEVTKKQRID